MSKISVPAGRPDQLAEQGGRVRLASADLEPLADGRFALRIELEPAAVAAILGAVANAPAKPRTPKPTKRKPAETRVKRPVSKQARGILASIAALTAGWNA